MYLLPILYIDVYIPWIFLKIFILFSLFKLSRYQCRQNKSIDINMGVSMIFLNKYYGIFYVGVCKFISFVCELGIGVLLFFIAYF